MIGPRPFTAGEGWRTIELGPSLLLSVERDLRVTPTTDRDGTDWYLLGTCVESRPGFSDPHQELASSRSADVREVYDGWSGRWVLVGEERLHPDATAMLGCYYGRDASGAVWASSSPVLIEHATHGAAGNGEPPYELPRLGSHSAWRPSPNATVSGLHRGVSWFPPPHSGAPGVFRLLPTQVLDLRDGSVAHRPVVRSQDGNLSDDEIVAQIGSHVQAAIRRLAALNAPRRLTLLLSGGQDSRTILSMAVAARVTLDTYTRIHRRATLADRVLPPRLSGMAGYHHRVRRQRRELAGRREAILKHAGYRVSWLSVEEFLQGGVDRLEGIALAGFCEALGRIRLIGDRDTGESIARHFGERNCPDLVSAFDAWIGWRSRHPEPYLDLDDLFFLEQRMAGRRAAKEQILDMFPVERIAPFNCLRLLALIARFSPETRVTASWIPDLVRTGDTRLADVPMNPPDSYFGFFRGRLFNFRGHRYRAAMLLRRSR